MPCSCWLCFQSSMAATIGLVGKEHDTHDGCQVVVDFEMMHAIKEEENEEVTKEAGSSHVVSASHRLLCLRILEWRKGLIL